MILLIEYDKGVNSSPHVSLFRCLTVLSAKRSFVSFSSAFPSASTNTSFGNFNTKLVLPYPTYNNYSLLSFSYTLIVDHREDSFKDD